MEEYPIRNMIIYAGIDYGQVEIALDAIEDELGHTEKPMYRPVGSEIYVDAMDITDGDVRNVAKIDLNDYADIFARNDN